MTLAQLYDDEDFMQFVHAAISRNIQYFDTMERADYEQEIFADLLESEFRSMQDAKRSVWRTLHRGRKRLKEQPTSVLWEDNHMVEAW